MNRIKFTSKTTLKLNRKPYKGYLIGDLPPSFGFKEKFDGYDDKGNNKSRFRPLVRRLDLVTDRAVS